MSSKPTKLPPLNGGYYPNDISAQMLAMFYTVYGTTDYRIIKKERAKIEKARKGKDKLGKDKLCVKRQVL